MFDVAQTSQGLYAIESGGHLVADRGEGWEIIFDDGPSTRNYDGDDSEMQQSDEQRRKEENTERLNEQKQ
jgi:hypothetical protein